MSLLGRAGHAGRMGVRLRYTILYGAMFLVSGVGLLAIVAAFSTRNTTQAGVAGGAVSAPEQIARLQSQLAEADDAHRRQLLVGIVTGIVVMLLVLLVLGSAL